MQVIPSATPRLQPCFAASAMQEMAGTNGRFSSRMPGMKHGHRLATHDTPRAAPLRRAVLARGCSVWVLLAASLATMNTPAQESPAQSAPPRLTVSEDGTLVIDKRSKVAWSRCVEGTQWNGKTCDGLPLLLDRTEALEAAKARSEAEGVAWRVPRANELRHLVNKRAVPPGVDLTLFPAAPGTWHWSSSTRVRSGTLNAYNYGNAMQGSTGGPTSQLGSFKLGWAVEMTTGEASGDVAKSSRLPVRLVRPYE